MTLITQKEYARRRRVTPQYINRLVGDGVIVLTSGKVDPVKADAAWQKAKGRKAHARAAGSGKRETAHHTGGRPARASATDSLTAAKRDKYHYDALRAKLDYETTLGKLLARDQVFEAQARQNANFRTRLRRLARSLAPLLARTASAAECEAIALVEIDLLLSELAVDPLGPEAVIPSVSEGSMHVPADVRNSLEVQP